MLLVGIDWAEAEHAACLLDEAGAVRRRRRVPHSAAGRRRLRAAVAEQEAAGAVLVAVERAHGLLVEALLGAGSTVSALNPKAVERSRARTRPAGAKSDPADAELLARILHTDRARHRPLRPSGPQAAALRALARDDERASRDERRLLNRLRHDLLDVVPQALVAFPRLADGSALAFLARWPTAAAAQRLDLEALERFFREGQHGWPARTATRVRAALAAEALAARPEVAGAKAGAVRLAAEQLLLLRRQRGAWRKELAALLGDRETAAPAIPAGAVLLSLPGMDVRLAARVLGEVGDDPARFATPNALQCSAGTAPVTKASGRVRVVAARFACNRFLRQALLMWALCSLRVSPWARAADDRHRQAGKAHNAVLRAVANRWLEILHHLLATGQRYDEAVHQKNRARAAGAAAA